MEKKRMRGRDIMRMDGLLPPTRRLLASNTTVSPDKKKEKKWSIGGILKRLSSVKDDNDLDGTPATVENDADRSAGSLTLSERHYYSRNSDGSIDGSGKKNRKSKMKARVEAKRDRLCPDSSSDEDSRISNGSSIKLQIDDCVQSSRKSSSCNRRTRAARTERYIKRLSKEEGNGDNGNSANGKRSSVEYSEDGQRISVSTDDLFRPSLPPRPLEMEVDNPIDVTEDSRDPVERGHDSEHLSYDKCTQYSIDDYTTDLNQNNTYGKIDKDCFAATNRRDANDARVFDYPRLSRSPNPPEPPPRDPRSRVYAYGCYSFPFNCKNQRFVELDDRTNARTDGRRGQHGLDWENVRSCKPKREVTRDADRQEGRSRRMPSRSNEMQTQPREYANNKCNSASSSVNDFYLTWPSTQISEKTEASTCQRKNNRNDQLSFEYVERDRATRPRKEASDQILPDTGSSPTGKFVSGSSNKDSCSISAPRVSHSEETSSERKRNSKNLEEALSELETIYNSLRLGDEDLLDRAERRSMEEFRLKRRRKQDKLTNTDPPESPDRSKDDMAYRRMHPVERGTSLSDVVAQSSLSNISYLIASPILGRKSDLEDYDYSASYPSRRHEPDVTRDDVVFRSMTHAKNTLKVVEPQPPFGIPLGPVATATESDYLHTKTSEPNSPRSPYIPRCEPDLVADDLAYRTLRKDANNSSKKDNERRSEVSKEPGNAAPPPKKKRAVRSLSANLYGLIDQNRIHLRRQPSLRRFDNDAVVGTEPFVEPTECFGRIVSDSEMSDYGGHCRDEGCTKDDMDINGNHPDSGHCRKMLRVYVAPATAVQRSDRNYVINPRSSTFSGAARFAKNSVAVDTWQDSTKSPNDSKDADSDFTTYSRLCQDLVNIIKWPEEQEERSKGSDEVPSNDSTIPKGDEEKESVTSAFLGRDSTDDDTGEFSRREDSNEDENGLDYYLRLADENLKLMTEAFDSVAKHLYDDRNHLPTSDLGPETENNDIALEMSSDFESGAKNEPRNSTIEEERLKIPEQNPYDNESNIERYLTKAVEDLQIAAASLCRNKHEIEKLETRNVKPSDNYDAVTIGKTDPNEGSKNLSSRMEKAEIQAEDAGANDRDAVRKGESTECDFTRKTYSVDFIRPTDMQIPYVTNIVTVTITEYFMVLLAFFLALLLAIIAAS